MKFFKYDRGNGSLELDNESLILTKEFKDLLEVGRNKSPSDKSGKNKEKAFKEFVYIYLFLDWESPYFQIPEKEKHLAALEDSGLTELDLEDELFKAACRKYDELQNSSLSIRLLKGAMSAVETLIYYLTHVDVNERDPLTGKPIFKTKDLIAEIKGCKDVIAGIKDLEIQVKKELEQDTGLRGNAEAGYFDDE